MLDGWASQFERVRKARAGRNTLKRGILLNTLARAEGGERPGILERALRQPRQLVARGLKDTFYQNDKARARRTLRLDEDGNPKPEQRRFSADAVAKNKAMNPFYGPPQEPRRLPCAHSGGSSLPGLRMPLGSSAALIARIAASSAALRLQWSQSRFSVPMPCSAEIEPPKSCTTP